MINKLVNFLIIWVTFMLLGYLFISLIELTIDIRVWRSYAHFIFVMHIVSTFALCLSWWDTTLYIRNVQSIKLECPNYNDHLRVSRTGSISIKPNVIVKSEEFKRQLQCVKELSEKYPNGFKCDDFGGQIEGCEKGECCETKKSSEVDAYVEKRK